MALAWGPQSAHFPSDDTYAPAEESSSTPQPSRRAVLRTAAWAAPAVVVVGTAPAFATTGGVTPASISVSHTPFSPTDTAINVTNVTTSPVTVTVSLPLSPDRAIAPGVYGSDWLYSGNSGSAWLWTRTVNPGESVGLRTMWIAGPSGGSGQVLVSVGADEIHTLDVEPPFVVTGTAARRASQTTGDLVMAPGYR